MVFETVALAADAQPGLSASTLVSLGNVAAVVAAMLPGLFWIIHRLTRIDKRLNAFGVRLDRYASESSETFCRSDMEIWRLRLALKNRDLDVPELPAMAPPPRPSRADDDAAGD